MYNKALFDFINNSPSAFHAVDTTAKMLTKAGYEEIYEAEEWKISAPGKYFVRRNGSSLIALRLPKPDFHGFMIMAAHSDSPSFKIKEQSDVKDGLYTRLNVEKYGGMICSSWLDRPLSAAGRVLVRSDKGLCAKLVNLEKDILMIPSVAIHMDRSVNDGKSFNPNVEMLPLMGSKDCKGLRTIIAENLNVKDENIVSTDLFIYPRTEGTVWGADNEYITSPRLDDLQCVFGCLKGLLESDSGESAAVLSIFDNEEVGSGTKQGADSSFLEDVLLRVCEALGKSASQYRALVAGSFMVSADNAHAVHPNHPEFADRNDKPEMNKGIVIKFNANQRYTTDAVSAGVFSEICRRADVPVQYFTNRADMPGGSTLGNISSAHVSLNTVDIGLPQLAMHSAVETAGAKDTAYLVSAAKEFYKSSFAQHGDQIEIR